MLTEGETAIKIEKFPKCEECEIFLQMKTNVNRALVCETARACDQCEKDKWRVDTAEKLQKPVDADTLHKWNRANVTETNIKRFHELEKQYPWITFELFVFLLGYEYRSRELLEALKR